MTPRVAILLSGRGSNMVALVEATRTGVLAGCCEITGVVSNVPAAPGLARARDLGVSTLALDSRGKGRPAFDAELVAALEPWAPDWLVLAGYMRILGPPVIRRWPGRIVNIHPADTRRHQGLHGYAWAWAQRLPETRITVHRVDEGLDTGPILAQRTVDLRGARDLAEVERRGLLVEHAFYAEVLRDLFIAQQNQP